jgi:hypothetical protein
MNNNHRNPDEWYTPHYVLEGVKHLLGGDITLDAFSSEEANKVVQAKFYFSKENSALKHNWFGRVFMCPPHSEKQTEEIITHAIKQLTVVEALVALTPIAPNAMWYKRLSAAMKVKYNTNLPIIFKNAYGDTTKQKQTIFYYGNYQAEKVYRTCKILDRLSKSQNNLRLDV